MLPTLLDPISSLYLSRKKSLWFSSDPCKNIKPKLQLNSNRGFFDNHVFVQLQDSKHICQQVRPLKVSAISQWLIFSMQWNDDHSMTPGTLNPGTIKSQVHKHQEAVNLKCYIRTRIPGWSIKYLRLHFIFNEYVFSWSIAKSQKTEKPTYDHIYHYLLLTIDVCCDIVRSLDWIKTFADVV